jgi:acetylornithine deacetylase/succinyl-diaminopimelate desuccinylase-like protein
MRLWLMAACLAGVAMGLAGCEKKQEQPQVTTAVKPKLGIRPYGDETIKIETSKMPAEEQKVFSYIDQNIDQHVENLQKWIQQPSISNSGEGIPDSAEMVKGFFDQLGCQQTRVYDVGMTEWGQPGNPVVYARCDEGAPKTLLIYWMYDTMPITQPDVWVAPPFEARLVNGKTAGLDPAFKKVLVGRGAVNSKGPEMTELNAFSSIKAVAGKLPVNLIFVAEGDEERMSMGLRKFVTTHPELLKSADALMMFGGQSASGSAGSALRGGSEGLMYVELTTSGKSWGRGPLQSDIHGIFKRSVDSPAWRHIEMLASLMGKDGNTPLIQGFNDNIKPLSTEETASLKKAAAKVDLKVAANNIGVARFISDDPLTMLKMSRYGTAFNLDGIWGGNMYAGGSGAILPNKITSKHSIRYVPNMHSADILKKIRAQLDKNGYKDVQVKLIGDQPWSTMTYDTDISHSIEKMYDAFGISWAPPINAESIITDSGGSGAWPGYLFTNGHQGDPNIKPLGLSIAGGGVGYGGRAHAANEYWVIEGAGKIYGMAGAEKSIVDILYKYAATTTVAK